MAGHSKRHNIKHRKAAQDAKKGKYYARYAKMIQLAAKEGADPSMNPRLALALQKAKMYNLPKDIITRAIAKWSANDTEDLKELYYEAYGPSGTAMIIKSITDNHMRTSQNVRALLSKHGATMSEPWSVSRQFIEQWQIEIDWLIRIVIEKGKQLETIVSLDPNILEEQILMTDAVDLEINDQYAIVTTTREDCMSITTTLTEYWYHIQDCSMVMNAMTPLSVDSTTWDKLMRVIDILEEDEDVSEIFHNACLEE